LAWLHSAPKAKKRKSRQEAYKDTIESKILPDDNIEDLIDMARECGLYSNTGMGIVPVSWQEVKAWQEATHNFSIWIAETIVKISREYVHWYLTYDDTDDFYACPMSKKLSEEGNYLV
jgi:hypothetical protein